MKITVFFLCFAKTVFASQALLDLHQVTNSLHYRLAQSTAAMISNRQLVYRPHENLFFIEDAFKGDLRHICSFKEFYRQTRSSHCSGFLVGKNLLLTAGHCLASKDDCLSHSWVFGYSFKHHEQTGHPIGISFRDIYRCQEVMGRSFFFLEDFYRNHDYTLVRLDRDVENRDIFSLRFSGRMADKAQVVSMGYPRGLPLKISYGVVKDNKKRDTFRTSLMAFPGSSGSPVIDAHTGLVEGMAIRGISGGYDYDEKQGCYVSAIPTDISLGKSVVLRSSSIVSPRPPTLDFRKFLGRN